MIRGAITGGLATAALMAFIGASSPPFVHAQSTATSERTPERQTSAEEKKGGTGVVPPGVKLVPEMPPAAGAKTFHFPQATRRTLENGIQIFVVTDHSEPAVAARLVIPSAGSLHDPADLPGVAQMTANLLTQGTEKRSAQQIAEEIDFVGGSLNAAADKDDTSVTLAVVKKDVDLGMGLMADVVLHPTFKQEELDRQREQLLSGLQVQYSDASYLASAVFNRVVYQGTSYGLPGEGTPETAAKLNRDAISRFHDETYAPNGALLGFAGDISAEEATALAEKYFGGWQKKEASAANVAQPENPSGIHIWLIDKPDAVQTQIRVGKPGIRRDDPDYIPLLVTNRIFGGGYNSRLNTEVRVKKGLTYGANSNFTTMKYAGAFRASTFTRTAATVDATKLVVDLIAKMSTGDVTPAELTFAKDYLAGVYPIQSETAEQVANRVLTVAEYGLPEDTNETYPEKVAAVDAAEVKTVAARYFGAKDLDIVLAGNVAQFRDALKQAFPDATYDEIRFDELDLLSPNLRKPKEATPAATPESLERGVEVVKAAAQAAGGTAFESLNGIEMTSSGKASTPQGDIPISLKLLIVYPDKTRSQVTLPFGTLVQVYDGKSGWVESPQGMMDLPPEYVGEFERSTNLTGGWGLYKAALAGNVKAQYLGAEDVDGTKTVAVEWAAPSGPIKLYFDASTHLLVGAHFKSLSPQGSFETDQRWSDFRTVDGKQFPYHSIVYRNGAKFSEVTVQSVTVNPTPDPSSFTKPQASPAPKP